MIQKFYMLVILCVIGLQVSAQIPTEKILLLLKENEAIGKINTHPVNINLTNEVEEAINLNQTQHILVNRGKVYLNNNGSSKLFLVDSVSLKPMRLDKTQFEGYNYGSAVFFYNDTLFNIGGYGFWNTTGAIRYFDTVGGEWNIIKTNKNISFSRGVNAISFYDENTSKLHVIFTKYSPEYIQNKNIPQTLYYQCLDMKTKFWLDNSRIINESFASSLDDLKILNETSGGVLMTSKKNEKTLYVDFSNNKIFSLDDQFITSYLQILHNRDVYLSISKEKGFKIYDITNDTIINFNVINKITSSLPDKIYREDYSNYINWRHLPIIIIFLLLILIIYLFSIIHKRKLLGNFKTTESNQINSSDFINFTNSLNDVEKDVLSLLISNSLSEKKASVEEINKVLGLEKRAYKIQNNIRAQIITSINKSFSAYINTKDQLIERERSNFDKRYFDYAINRRFLHKLSNKLKESI
jgi:hypothetical protein